MQGTYHFSYDEYESPENKPEWFPGEDERKRYYLTAYNYDKGLNEQ